MSQTPESQPVVEVEPPPVVAAPRVRRRVVPKSKEKRAASPRPRRTLPTASSQPTLADLAAEEQKDGFFKRHAVALIVGGLVVAGGLGLTFYTPGPPAALPVKQERIVMIAPLPPLPKPLPPPPPPQKPPEEKMEKETAAEETKPVEKPAPPKAPEDPAPLGTNLKGDGAGLSGLGSGPGLGGGTIGGSSAKSGSRFGWYAGQVQAKISEALRRHPQTRNASLRLDVRIWPDATGRITRAQLIGSTGEPALDRAIQGGVLTGLQLAEPPPVGMKLPINLRLSARRPN